MLSSSTASKLDSMIGLESAKRVIRSLAEEDRGIHAILLYGTQGTGKAELARLITELWLCTTPSSEGADGECRACSAFKRGHSPDVLNIVPLGLSSIIPVKAIFNDKPQDDDPLPLITFFRTSTLLSRHKVAIIHDAHRMNGAAANALLKTLEEPHPHAKILLTTDTVGSLLPTILSRCLGVACEAPSEEDLARAFPDATADEIRLSGGAPGRMTVVISKRELYARLLHFARQLPSRRLGEALVASEEFQAICSAFQSADDAPARATQAELLSALATFYAREPSAPQAWTHLIIEAHRRILGNGGASIVFDALFAALLRVNR